MSTVAEQALPAAKEREPKTPQPRASGSKPHSPLEHGTTAIIFGLVVIAVLYLGWKQRDAGYITAKHGLGYLLGIAGGTMMTMLLLYPLRKKQVRLFRWGAIRHWFRMHMVFGIVGPVTILYHSDFRLGAINSNVALISMLLVAGSGLVGRYFYTRIHYGLYGARMSLEGLQGRVNAAQGHVASLFRQTPEALDTLRRLERWLLKERNGLFRLVLLPIAAVRCWAVRIRVNRQLRRALGERLATQANSIHSMRRSQQLAAQFVSTYVETLRRVAEIGTYERLFSWWHILHLPLFLMMLLAGVAHVIAVHMY